MSYPKGYAVNDFVNRDAFYDVHTIDDIANDIIGCMDDPVLFKVNVERAVCNLCVDSAYSLKFGIQWQGKLYLDVTITFSWVHGMAAFQLCSDTIAFIMAKQDIKLHCYINDYIAVVHKVSSDVLFQCLHTLLQELGFPVNSDKLTPPTKRRTCLGIEVDIEGNVLPIAPDKLHEIHQECLHVCQKMHLSK